MKLELDHGKNPAYVSTLPSKISMMLGSGWLSTRIRKLGTHIVSPLFPTPVIHTNNEAWAMKNTSLAAQQLMMAATAFNLRTTPMEGFDERRVCYNLGIPLEEYAVPMIVSIGYSADASINSALESSAQSSFGDVADGDDAVDTSASSLATSNEGTSVQVLASSAVTAECAVTAATKHFPSKQRFPLSDICYSERFNGKLDI